MLIQLDDAWRDGVLELPTADARSWGPRLRYSAPAGLVEAFAAEVLARTDRFVVYGSGDYHYLTRLLVRRAAAAAGEPLALVAFDNHPDWDVRPPRWSCGGWAARAAHDGRVRRVSVWGCGNFELRYPSRVFADHRALRSGRLDVHAWRERQPPHVCSRFACMTRATWRTAFADFASSLADTRVYVTVDLDCLEAAEAVTNWENGLFTADDVAWAIRELRGRADVVGGDVCGAWSEPRYARATQRFAGEWDHPELPARDVADARRVNERALAAIWAALSGQPPRADDAAADGPHSAG